MIRIVLWALLLTGCNSAFQANTAVTVDSGLAPYVAEYQLEKGRFLGTTKIRKINVVFKSLSPDRMGQCIIQSDGFRQIEIDPEYWYTNLDEVEKELLIFHELGHCDLHLDHIPDVGIMYISTMDQYTYLGNRDYYLNQLFTSKK